MNRAPTCFYLIHVLERLNIWKYELTRTISFATDFSVTPAMIWKIDSRTAKITFTRRLRTSSNRMVMEYTLRNMLPPPPAAMVELFLEHTPLALEIMARHILFK
jgi:hypothetical protein